MKKKYSLFYFIIFFLIHSNVFSKDSCSLFFDELKNNSEKYKPQLAPSFVYEDFGFELETYYASKKHNRLRIDSRALTYFRTKPFKEFLVFSKII